MKNFTSLEQSRNLINILPLSSADMYYDRYGTPSFIDEYVSYMDIKNDKYKHLIPAWSLAALLGVLPKKYTELIKEGGMYRIIIKDSCMTCLFDNPVDACVAMIEKLHKLNLL